jgi:hypothetical protein
MPIVATMTIIALLRSNASGDQPFFDPALLREMLAEGLDDEADELLARAMLLANELETITERYRATVESTIDAYIEASEDPRSNASSLSKRFAAMDQDRSELMGDIVRLRRSLVDLLSDEQWQAVFD